MKSILLAILGFFLLSSSTVGTTLSGTIETGFLAVLAHKIQLSKDGTYFDYVQDGGQDVLSAITRFSVDWRISQKHCISLLYQPLALESREVLKRDVKFDGLLYPAGTNLLCRYYFPFYRVSYLRNLSSLPERETSLGLSLQIRNATIDFESLDGTLLRTNRNIGPVPIIKFRIRRPIGESFWWGTEADGFYAPISYLNGSDTEVTGAILDASVRGGFKLSVLSEVFLNLRYLGGGAVGQSKESGDLGDGYVKNWLHFMTVTMGFTHQF